MFTFELIFICYFSKSDAQIVKFVNIKKSKMNIFTEEKNTDNIKSFLFISGAI